MENVRFFKKNFENCFKWILVCFLNILFLFSSFLSTPIFPEPRPKEIQNVDLTEKLGTQVSPDLKFKDTNGESHPLSYYFSKNKIVILNLAYFNCPMLCNMVSKGLAEALLKSKLPLGEKYQVLTISINPLESKEDAIKYRNKFFDILHTTPDQQAYWQFLTGSEDQIKMLADQVGFGYQYNAATKQYSHGAGIIFLSKTGKVMRYLYGIEFNTFDIKMGILESLENKSRSTVEKVMVFCYNYDPNAQKYVLFAMSLMRYSALLMIVLISFFVFFLIKKSSSQD
jgi:protein SCO1/2